jgi:hypothetical protein
LYLLTSGIAEGNRSPADALRSLFVPFASARMEAFPVNSWVSDPKHEGARCLEPA